MFFFSNVSLHIRTGAHLCTQELTGGQALSSGVDHCADGRCDPTNPRLARILTVSVVERKKRFTAPVR